GSTQAVTNESGMVSGATQVHNYNCSECPAYCCAVYERVQVNRSDVERIARHFQIETQTALARFTKTYQGERILRQKADPIFGKACKFLDPQTRQCSIYDARPRVCRDFPAHPRCAYYDLLQFERVQQGDQSVIPLVQITFRNGHDSAGSESNSQRLRGLT